jgi:hypothetical protein
MQTNPGKWVCDCVCIYEFPLTSLEQLNLSNCSILESFPKILGKMDKIREIHIRGSPIKEYPFSIQNLTRLRKLELQMCGMVRLPSSIFVLPELSEMHVSRCEGLSLSEQDNGMQMVFNFFFNVKDLNLSGNNFTTLHAWIKECHLLRNLKMDDCSSLREIRGIPWKLEKISVKGCKSLRCLDLTILPECTAQCCFLKELILDDCACLREITGLPPNLDSFSAKGCTSLTSQSISMLCNQVLSLFLFDLISYVSTLYFYLECVDMHSQNQVVFLSLFVSLTWAYLRLGFIRLFISFPE